jgi:hypothetical protein
VCNFALKKAYKMEINNSFEIQDSSFEEAVSIKNGDFEKVTLHPTDWTAETIVSQLKRGNIVLNPSFQRRDAWNIEQKSRFIESLIVGIPVPQIVLAEVEKSKGKYIVLDGKQRLLSILQFWGLGEGEKNEYELQGLEIRKKLIGKKLHDLENDPDLEADYNALLNQTIRTVVIRNSISIDFLHLVFLRLNTGSVKLSPQELRQALFPGKYSEWIDKSSANSKGLKGLLRLKEPDYRMRDVEILARFIAFRFMITEYKNSMKNFLDDSFEKINADWLIFEPKLKEAMVQFESALNVLTDIFGKNLGRRPEKKLFNKAIFDFLIFYAAQPNIREKMKEKKEDILQLFNELFDDSEFLEAIDKHTTDTDSVIMRFNKWGDQLSICLGMSLMIPFVLDKKITLKSVRID